jgi:hypothetical protein
LQVAQWQNAELRNGPATSNCTAPQKQLPRMLRL